MKALGIFGLIVLIFVIIFVITSSDERNITARLAEDGTKVTDIDSRTLSIGPFWYKDKYHRIYRVDTDKGVYWVRTGGFGDPDLYKENEDGEYTEIDW